MKQFAIIVTVLVGLISTVSSENVSSRESINDMVIGFIEQFKEIMPCGVPELGVPVMVPLELNHTEFEFEQSGLLYLDAELDDLFIDGLNDFNIVDVNVKLLQMQLDFEFFFNGIKTTGHYNAKGSAVGLIPFNRGGKFGFNVNGLTLGGSIKLALDGDKISVSSFQLRPTVLSVNSKFEGVFLLPLNTFIFNRIVEAAVPAFLRDNQQLVTEFLEGLVMPPINDALSEYSLQDLMDMIGGEGPSLPSGC
ncbi:conserved hypothetical protein [Culex quinquefasciatus]|uniref:Hemolymph juvenile hormone binding protein n=1 Tax=Culex quinquefasciatus TaxID=7176 RepID=B0WY36_CULQU|nr:conserved hypothetical protein [Culex quinquefasciatus]|eukprot:XP_001862308.1 conserved hypothetical protein [Culex quinquefasciatus]